MKKHLLLTLLLSLAFVLPSLAQLDPDPDGVGIYADLDGLQNNLMTGEGIIELYVLATGISAPDGMAAWELSLFYDGPLVYAGHVIPYNNVNVGQWPSYSVGHAQAVHAPAPIMHLMTLTFVVTGTNTPGEIFIRQADMPEGGSIGNNLPAYCNGVPPYDLYTMFPSSGGIDAPVFRVNGDQPVATKSVSFSGIKALFK